MGGRLHTRFLSLKKSGLSRRESLIKSFRKTADVLILTSHSGPMHTTAKRPWLTIILGVLTLIVWAWIIWMACYVSTIILQLLQQIVDLAAISP